MPSKHPASTHRTFIAPLTAALDALWRCAAHRSTATVLMAPFLLALALAPALPQAPWDLVNDPAGMGRWLASLQARWGSWVCWLARAGLASLWATPLFRLLWAVVGFAALVATVDRLLAWRSREVKGFPRHVLAHIGLLLLLAGVLVDERWGWDQEALLVGGDRPVPVEGGLLYLQQAEAGLAGDAVMLRWQRGNATGTGEIGHGRPLWTEGAATVHLLQTSSAVRLRLTDAADRVLPLDDPAAGGAQPEVTLRFPAEGDSRYVSVPSRDWVIRVTRSTEAAAGSPFTLWVYRGLEAAPLAQAPLTAGGEIRVAELCLRWQVLPYADVRAAFQPGLALWAGGWVLLCLGLLLSLMQQAGASRAAVAPVGRALWLAAALPLGALARAEAGRFLVQQGALPVRAGGLLLAWAAMLLLLAAVTGLLVRPRWRWPAWWREAPGWALLLWTAGGGVIAAANWPAGGRLWQWSPRLAGWALVWCLLVGAWHRGRERGRGDLVLEAGVAALMAAAVAVAMG